MICVFDYRNVLLLDEPTNHLDLESTLWLEEFLSKQTIPVVVVSHDREFLDRICTKIVDMVYGVSKTYYGNFSKYLNEKKALLKAWVERYEKQQKFIASEEKWIKNAKNELKNEQNTARMQYKLQKENNKHGNQVNTGGGSSALAQQIRNKEKALEKLRATELVEPPPKEKRFRFRFPDPPRVTNPLLMEINGVAHGYSSRSSSISSGNDAGGAGSEGEKRLLFKHVSFRINKGDRIGLLGPNGCGS